MFVFPRRPLAIGALLLTAPTVLLAQSTGATPGTRGGAARAITPTDISAWKSIRGATLSNDGAWFAYTVAPNEGDAEVVIRQTASGGKEHRFSVGEAPAAAGGPPGGGGGTAALQLSGDGQWAAMLVYPKAADQKRMRRERRAVQSKLRLVNLGTGEAREFDKIRRFSFGGDSPKWVALQAYAPEAGGGGGGAGGGGGGGLPGAGAPGMGGNPIGGGGGRVDGTDLLLH